jgi:hypothetical protein
MDARAHVTRHVRMPSACPLAVASARALLLAVVVPDRHGALRPGRPAALSKALLDIARESEKRVVDARFLLGRSLEKGHVEALGELLALVGADLALSGEVHLVACTWSCARFRV